MNKPNDFPSRPAADEFEALYTACSHWLYCYLLSLLRNPADAEEVLQETARLLWEKFDQYQPGTEFRAWACRIAHFKAIKFRERQHRAPSPFSDLFISTVEEEAVVMADRLDARMDALAECVGKLRPEQRELIDMRYAGDLAVAEVAARRRQSVHVVYRNLARIRDLLFQCIERRVLERTSS